MGLFILAACATQKNAEKYYNNHPEDRERMCAKNFPRVDSVGDTVRVFIPGSSFDYTGSIDSLKKESDRLLGVIEKDSARAVQVSQDCAKIVSEYKGQIKGLSAKISALNANYKKPIPDTQIKIVEKYSLPPAYVAQEKVNKRQIDSLGKQCSVISESRDDYKQKAAFRMRIIFALGGVIGLSIFLKIKRIF